MIVIVKEKVRKISSAMVARLIGTSIGPFASEGLDEALGLNHWFVVDKVW